MRCGGDEMCEAAKVLAVIVSDYCGRGGKKEDCA